MTILSDLAVADRTRDDSEDDQLELQIRVGPAFDIIRHKGTDTPLAVAVTGSWGSGKTSAMRWLQSELERWSDQDDRGTHPRMRTVWFEPWKYHKRDDVWRGLIAETIIHCIDVKNVTPDRLLEAAKQFGGFLGKSFLHALSNISVKAEFPGVKAEAKGSLVRDVFEEYQKTAHPERGYLNEFEDTLKSWIDSYISKSGERLVIFIDDLDRCLPDVTLEVLEALKLYLAIPNLVFVLGVDRDVVDAIVQKHYVEHGVSEQKSRDYLDKMFQVEIPVSPSEQQVEAYLSNQINRLNELTASDDGNGRGYWDRMFSGQPSTVPVGIRVNDEKYDPALGREIISAVIYKLCRNNPREVKRLLNGVMIGGSAAVRSKSGSQGAQLRFAQGAQTRLIGIILSWWHRSVADMLLDSRESGFYEKWSKIARRHPGDPPPHTRRDQPDGEEGSYKARRRTVSLAAGDEGTKTQDDHYEAFERAWTPHFGTKIVEDLLSEPELHTLMTIPFSREVASFAAASVKREAASGLAEGSEKKAPAGGDTRCHQGSGGEAASQTPR